MASSVPNCVVCNSLVDDNIAICEDCAPREHLTQDATVKMGDPVSSHIKAKAREGSKGIRPHFEVTVRRNEWHRKRKRHENITRLIDRKSNRYVEVYQDPATGEETYRSEGPLDDQSLHGNTQAT